MKPLRVHPLWIGSVLGFILLLIVWNCFVPNQAAIPDVIRIGVEDDYVPFSYTDEKGQRVGFDVDISSALCKKLNFRCEILPMPFGKLLPELSKGNLAMVVAGIGITPDRAKHFLFTNVYYRSRSFFITNNRKLAPASTANAAKLVIGVQKDTFQQELIEKHFIPAGAKMKTYAK